MTCSSCHYCRKTKVPDYICCALFTAMRLGFKLDRIPTFVNPKWNDSFYVDSEELLEERIIASGVTNAGYGWAYIHIRPDHVSSSKPSLAEGYLCNNCVLVGKNQKCINYQVYEQFAKEVLS